MPSIVQSYILVYSRFIVKFPIDTIKFFDVNTSRK